VRLVNEYARTKYAGECLALIHDDCLVVRTNIVGFRGWAVPTYLEWLLEALRRETPISIFDDFFTSSITTRQFSGLLFQLLATPAKGRLNLAAREGSSKFQFTLALAEACGLSTKACRRGSIRELKGATRAESLVLDVSRAEQLLNTRLPDRRTVAGQIADEYRKRRAAS
jgi:dTDP-4-dehydrorhamnose reductase